MPTVVCLRPLHLVSAAAVVTAFTKLDPRCYETEFLFEKQFVRESFYRARAELGLDPIDLPQNWRKRFPDQTVGKRCVILRSPTRCYLYHQIYKCANDAIRESLMRATEHLPLAYRAKDVDCRHLEEEAKPHCRGTPLLPFTFVREPLTHYLSGYGEYIFRFYVYKNLANHTPMSQIRDAVIAPDEPRAIALEHVAGPEWRVPHPSLNIAHMALMSAAAAPRLSHVGEPALHFVGKLETAQTDWDALFADERRHAVFNAPAVRENDDDDDLSVVNGPPRGASSSFSLTDVRLSTEYGQHVSSLDHLGLRAELKRVLAANETLRRGLCRILERDYICFRYDIDGCLNGSALDRQF